MPPPSEPLALDATISHLKESARRFGRLDAARRVVLLEKIGARFLELSDRLTALDCLARGLDPMGPLAGQVMFQGPAISERYVQELARALRGERRVQLSAVRVDGGRTKVSVIPGGLHDSLLFPGLSGEVWLEGEREEELRGLSPIGLARQNPNSEVSLVLGAGNVASIPVLDVLHQCIALGRPTLLKMSPVNAYLGPLLELAFAPLIAEGGLAFAYGGVEVGQYLTAHAGIDAVHVTGSLETHDAIVWGRPSKESDERRARGTPLLEKPVTSELGNVSPVIVVPGAWSDREIAHAARSIAGSFVFNAGFNCNATKLIVTPRGTDVRERLLGELARVLESVPPRRAFYPGAREKYELFTSGPGRVQKFGAAGDGELPWALVTELEPTSAAPVFQREPFCAVLSEVSLGSADAGEFLGEATRFLNEDVFGTLNAMLLAPSDVLRDPVAGRSVERAVSELRYGSVCVNVWPAVAYGIGTVPWGGHPSSTLQNAQSGLGFGHNSLGLPHVEKTVLRAPLVQFPTPLWYPNHRSLQRLAKRFVEFEAKPGVSGLFFLSSAALSA
jgi:acyl-CoA reductase-like NAD-dependent aldehyde dehydrogenase